jgi:cytochrome o ubiquinol oxidase operon protein cyoD
MNTFRQPQESSNRRIKPQEGGTKRTYVTGFALSVGLTLVAYWLVTRHVITGAGLVFVILVLAFIQFLVQLFFFLHLGHETKPRWRLLVLSFMIMIVLILVVGSIWIMNNLNYRMTPGQMNTYMQNQDGGI